MGLDTETDVGLGRLLPTTAQQQLTSTLAKWFGATDDEIESSIVPDIAKFDNIDLGFMKF